MKFYSNPTSHHLLVSFHGSFCTSQNDVPRNSIANLLLNMLSYLYQLPHLYQSLQSNQHSDINLTNHYSLSRHFHNILKCKQRASRILNQSSKIFERSSAVPFQKCEHYFHSLLISVQSFDNRQQSIQKNDLWILSWLQPALVFNVLENGGGGKEGGSGEGKEKKCWTTFYF